jgi:hypothetical protein
MSSPSHEDTPMPKNARNGKFEKAENEMEAKTFPVTHVPNSQIESMG